MKQITNSIKSSLHQDESLLTDVSDGFTTNRNLVAKTAERMDTVLSEAANNVWCYVVLFILLVFAIKAMFSFF